jgi:poly-beta-1,6-N-acetyl-D-glucosamine synthase
LYRWMLALQCMFYAAAACGYGMRNAGLRLRILKVPYVFCMLNWAVVAGFVRFIRRTQRVTWDKALPANEPSQPEQRANRA